MKYSLFPLEMVRNSAKKGDFPVNYRKKLYCCEKTENEISGEMAEQVEGARLLSECMPKGVPRVRIPLFPPYILPLFSAEDGCPWAIKKLHAQDVNHDFRLF